MTIQQILNNGVEKINSNKIENPLLKARVLLAYALNVKKEYLVIHSNDEIDEENVKRYNQYIEQLINHKPLQYITKHQEFMKLDFYVDENVLIPRADTEILVEEVINMCGNSVEKKYDILDLCAGSGAIGISIAKYVKNSNVTEVDISDDALNVAKKNTRINKVENVEFIKSNMFEELNGKFDIIVSNPPYIKKNIIKELDKEVQNEPLIALDGGEDGLDFYRIIVNEAYKFLKEDGMLFLEIGYDQKEDVIKLLNESRKYKDIYSKKDLFDNDRIVVANVR